ncbi:MAG TPA: hypothetical protein VGM39_13380 [Kofleriaceae bacterium]|jgi:hypothetical protein
MRHIIAVGILVASSVTVAHAKPPAETDELAKALLGTWKCTGKTSPNGGVTWEQLATRMMVTRTLDNQWIQIEGMALVGNQRARVQMFIGYIAAENKYVRHTLATDGSYATESATLDRAMGGTWGMEWTGDAHTTPSLMYPASSVRATDKFSAGVLERTGEVSSDGKAWKPAYDMSCKK